MGFRTSKRSPVAPTDPVALFNDLRGTRQVEGLLTQQADVLRAYAKLDASSPHVAIRLPTGSGKTLVGLLIAEWRRRKNGERALYLCPTRQLVHQVAAQASDQYGIHVEAFVGS